MSYYAFININKIDSNKNIIKCINFNKSFNINNILVYYKYL